MSADSFGSMSELLRKLAAPDNYSILVDRSHGSRIKLFAPHGGCIEPCTGAVTLALADGLFDSYVFQGLRRKDCFKTLHVTSTRFDEPGCVGLAREAELAIAIHGCDGDEPFLLTGGGNPLVREECENILTTAGFDVRPAPRYLRGDDRDNFINLARQKGLQLEMSTGFRKKLFYGFPGPTGRSRNFYPTFISELRKWMNELENRLHPNVLPIPR